MGKFSNYMLVSDFDGTLINRNGQISTENITAIQYFIDNGGLFCGATGRTHLNIVPYMEKLPVIAPWILFNGAGVYDFKTQEFIHEDRLDEKELIPLTKSVIRAVPHINVQICTTKMLYLVNPNAIPDVHIESENQLHETVDLDEIDSHWIKLMFQGTQEDLKKVEGILASNLDLELYRYFYSGVSYLEVMGKSVSKGSGLHALKNIINDPNYHYCAIGDYYNDVEMLKEAEYSAAPDNAPEDIKAHATVVVNHHDHHAVKDFIEWLERNI